MSYCCIIQYQINTDRLLKSRLEKSPRLFPLNIVYLFCEVRYGWSPLMRRNIVSASQAPFSLSNSALWRFFNGQMLRGEKIKAFLLRQGRNSRYSTSARAWWNVWGSAWLFISISSNSFMYNTRWVVSSNSFAGMYDSDPDILPGVSNNLIIVCRITLGLLRLLRVVHYICPLFSPPTRGIQHNVTIT